MVLHGIFFCLDCSLKFRKGNFDYLFKLHVIILFAGETNDEAETDEDPLDSFMNEINKEVKKGKSNFRQMPAGAKKTGIVVGVKKTVNKIATAGIVQSKNGGSDAAGPKKPFIMMSGVAKKKDLKVDRRGELIEQNQDGLEYSSEEEVCLMIEN